MGTRVEQKKYWVWALRAEQKYWVWALRTELYGAEVLGMGTKSRAEVLDMGTKSGAVRSRSTGYGH